MEVKQKPDPAMQRRVFGEDPERILGTRVRALREGADMTQGQLAERMTMAGFSMHQTAIGKIEANQRPVTVNEAVVLATLLGVTLPDLLADPDLTEEEAGLREEMQKVITERQAIQRERAEWKSQVAAAEAVIARAHAQLGLSAPVLRDLEARERELKRQWRIARMRSKGYSSEEAEEYGL